MDYKDIADSLCSASDGSNCICDEVVTALTEAHAAGLAEGEAKLVEGANIHSWISLCKEADAKLSALTAKLEAELKAAREALRLALDELEENESPKSPRLLRQPPCHGKTIAIIKAVLAQGDK